MAEKIPIQRHSFFSFWGSAIKTGWTESREKFGHIVDITLGLSVIGILIFAWYSKQHPKFDADKENAIMSYWFAVIPVGLWIIWLLYHILKEPYKIYLEIHGEDCHKYQSLLPAQSSPENDEEKDAVFFATRILTPANTRDGKYIFEKCGEYILHINVVGYKARTEIAKLKFSWTGLATTSRMEIIDV